MASGMARSPTTRADVCRLTRLHRARLRDARGTGRATALPLTERLDHVPPLCIGRGDVSRGCSALARVGRAVNSYSLPRAACQTARRYYPDHARYVAPATLAQLHAQRRAAERLARLGYVVADNRDYRAMREDRNSPAE